MKDVVISHLAAVPMRGAASHRAEMVSELLFGERAEVLEHSGEWLKVRGMGDGYEGWIDARQMTAEDGAATERLMKHFGRLVSPTLLLRGERSPMSVALHHYAGAPYLWGGRTPMGIDCSGLVQNCFLACGVQLPRDAYQQAEVGLLIFESGDNISTSEFYDLLRVDDLCFFGTEERVTHVGIYMGNEQIIHASGWVRTDRLTMVGIENETKTLTHRLKSIRRIEALGL